MKAKKKILVCPLDWGLGHATRSIPVIEEFRKKGCEVRIASSGDALTLLKMEFPDLVSYELTGYRPYYSKSAPLMFPLAAQMPKFLKAIHREHGEIEKIVSQDNIACIISDNRYGCWSSRVPGALITHQLNIKVPRLLSAAVNAANRRRIGKFSACWVPDREGRNSLTGALSANPEFPVEYIGVLSRFHRMDHIDRRYEVLALISGPEPQRAILENILRSELKKSGKKSLMVRGMPGPQERKSEGCMEVVNHLTAEEMNLALLESEIVVSRSGYSTIMDLAKLGKKAIFVPTPGQPEQEYLGKELMKKGIALCKAQDGFNITTALGESQIYAGFEVYSPDNLLRDAIDKILPCD